MTVISVSITQSVDQVVSGIPRTISITTSIPATIFYTLDGTTPTLFSTIYTGTIFLPVSQLAVMLNVMATDGVNSSPVVSECYMTNVVSGNARLPHSSTNAQAGSSIQDTYPFGTPPFQPDQIFENPARSGVTVYDPNKPAISNAFDADGYPTGFTNRPYNLKNYGIVYTETDAQGERSFGVGNLPATTTVVYPPPPPEFSSQFTQTFDPRALVIFQDFSNEDPNNPPQINKQYFSLEDPEKVRDGTYYYNSGVDSTLPPSGSFVRAHFNPRDNTITHYYRDSWANRWIISTSPYQPNNSAAPNFASEVMGGNPRVLEWIPFSRRILF